MPNGPVAAPAPVAAPVMAPAPAPRKKDNTVKLLVGVGVLAAAGYLGYRYWYVPRKARQILEAETQRRMQQGVSGQDAARQAMASLCGPAGTAIGAAYGVPIPPDVGQTICAAINPLDLINVASQAISAGVNLATDLVTTGIGAVGSIGGAVGGAVSDITSGVGGVITSVAEVPLDLATGAVETVVDIGGTVARGASDFIETGANVVADVLCPWC